MPLVALALSNQAIGGLIWLLGAVVAAAVFVGMARPAPGGASRLADATLLRSLVVTGRDDQGRPVTWKSGSGDLVMRVGIKLGWAVAVLVGLGMSLAFAGVVVFGRSSHWEAIGLMVGLSLFVLLMSAMGAASLVAEPWAVRRETALSDEGVMLRTAVGLVRARQHSEVVPWEEIADVTLHEHVIRSNVGTYSSYFVRLDLRDGREVILGGALRPEALEPCLQALMAGVARSRTAAAAAS